MFHRNAPRPPVVPGEETDALVQKGISCAREVKSYNPGLTPRTSSLYHHSYQDGHAPLGFEPEGRSGSPQCGDSRSPPGYLLWARDLASLLSDPDGVTLFKKYLVDEGKPSSDQLDFWFAIEGLHKQTDPDRIGQFVKVIYRRYFLKSQLGISDSQRKSVQKRVNDTSQYDTHIFDKAQAQVEKIINDTTYPNFLRSDVYLNHVQAMQNGCIGSSSGSSGPESHSGGGGAMLATLHEDEELEIVPSAAPASFAPLTKDMLMYTQKRRASDAVPKPEAFAGMYLHGKGSAKVYSSYNPVSRQDSELQSLSSDARTESDNLSLTDSSVDGMSYKPTRKHFQRHYRQAKESANLNKDPMLHQTVIPRTLRVVKDQAQPMNPQRFADILIEKLEIVKRNQEAEEKFAHKLLENDDGCGPSAKTLADAIRERFGIDDDNDQDILDQHVSRVWSDLTPSRTPGLVSPRPRSPDAARRSRSCQSTSKASSNPPPVPLHGPLHHPPAPHPYLSRPPHPPRYSRRDRLQDGLSTFSSDSGVHGFSEDKLHLPKSKSVPDYSDSTDTYASVPSHDGKFRTSSRDWSANRRHLSKKPELTDSGVSVVSESVSIGSHGHKEKVMSWLNENDSSCSHSHADRDSEKASSCSGGSRYARPNPVRGRRSPPTGPAQPFVADPSMPPLGPPHTPTQLDEARRRLEDQVRCKQTRQRSGQGSKQEISTSSGSTLKKSKDSTTVVYSFCEEQFPYLVKIPGTSVMLKQFKEYLPKKGNYRFFFKTVCEELDMKVIQEEITDDNEVLPLWEGKVMAQVKAIE
ncbi:Axis inhibition protein [Nesidiocoris tenuis]|uniref:Axis inhibition protein n=1 Tax=Nesidiocoris tenuis TaxID=355587 RepID=A0ABN7BCA9_9HEMI|nr:Axis inhibition protein [Nesidiocoris tenuis]